MFMVSAFQAMGWKTIHAPARRARLCAAARSGPAGSRATWSRQALVGTRPTVRSCDGG
jgi:hypothetical protein